MMEKIKKKKLVLILLLGIIVIGFILRSYNFSEWLHFEIDQSYDTLLVSPAIEGGINKLPLLGPNAGGGDTLRLGPAYYYLEYFSAKLFGNTPTGHAMFVLILSILSMPLFYLFCRRYFSTLISFGLLTIFCLSLYLVIYGRFSWNPNVLPFFVLLTFYALLRSVSKDEVKKNIWFFVFAISLAILTQIHFNAFFIILATTIVFLLIKRPRLNWKIWLGSLAIFTLIYSPLIINDIKLHGKNLHFFVDRLDKKESHPLTIIENVSQSLQYIASNNFLIISGINTIDTQKRLSHYGFSSDSKVMIWRILIFLFFLTEIFFLIKNLKNEKNETRKDFLILIGLWLFFSSAYLYQINKSYTIFPRFFLIVAPLSIILVGLIIEKIKPKANKKRLAIFLSIIFILVFSNALKIKNYFYQFSRVQIDDILVETEDVFPNTARVTLGQQNKITDYIYSKYNENKYPVYLIAKHEYEPIFWYHLEKREVFFRQIVKKTTIYKNGNYFLITFPNEDISKYSLRFDITEKKEFGALDVYFLEPKTEAIVPEQQKYPLKKSAQKKEIDKVMTWEKIFAKN